MTNEELAALLEKLVHDRTIHVASFRLEYIDALETAAIRLRATPD